MREDFILTIVLIAFAMLAIDALPQVTFGSGKNPDFPLGSPTEFTNNHEKDFTKYRNKPAESSPATGSDIKSNARVPQKRSASAFPLVRVTAVESLEATSVAEMESYSDTTDTPTRETTTTTEVEMDSTDATTSTADVESSARNDVHVDAKDSVVILISKTTEKPEQSSGEQLAENETKQSSKSTRPTVLYLKTRSSIKYRYAVTETVSKVLNPDSKSNEIVFSLTLPESAFISKFSMEIDHVVYEASVEKKEKAKEVYDAAVQAGQSAALVAVNPRDSTRFSVSVNVGAKEKVTFTLIYEELLLRRNGFYEQRINLNPGQLVPTLEVHVDIQEAKNFTKLIVPELRKELLVENEKANNLARIEHVSGSHVTIDYSPTLQDQKLLRETKPGVSGTFVVRYDVDHSPIGELYVVDGYFVHYLAPDATPYKPMPKHAVFVIDTSGSMFGFKMEQTKDAMKTIIKELTINEDYLSIVTFSSGARVWEPEIQEKNITADTDPLAPRKVTPDLIKRANAHIDSWTSDGQTDIDSALKLAFKQAQKSVKGQENEVAPESLAQMIIFLTDGVPTQGETDTERIVKNMLKRNDEASNKVLLFTIAFGDDTNFKFLKKLGLRNNGFARKIYADSDSSLQLTGFFEEISSPILTNVNITYLGGKVDEDSTPTAQPSQNVTAFRGTEIVMTGKLESASDRLTAYTVSALTQQGSVTFNGTASDVVEMDLNDKSSFRPYSNFLERLWAYQTVRLTLDRMETVDEEEKLSALKEKALNISLKFSFVTPLTSLVVNKPDQNETGSQVQAKLSAEDLDADAGNPAFAVASNYQQQSASGPGQLYSYGASSGFAAGTGVYFNQLLSPLAPAAYAHRTTARGFFSTTTFRPTSNSQSPPSTEKYHIPESVPTTEQEVTTTSESIDSTTVEGFAEEEKAQRTTTKPTAEQLVIFTAIIQMADWTEKWVNANPNGSVDLAKGDLVLIDGNTTLALAADKFVENRTCANFGNETTAICTPLYSCVNEPWEKCDLGKVEIQTLIPTTLCQLHYENPADASVQGLQGICCPTEKLPTHKCPPIKP